MLEEKKLRKRMLLRLLGSPGTVAPLMLGITALTAVGAFGLNPGLGLFAALSGFLGAGGAFFTQLLLGGKKIAQELIAEMAREQKQANERALDDLDHRLATADNDPRTETALRDLRALLDAFEENVSRSDGFHVHALFGVRSMVTQLFDRCVQSLEQTLRLWQMAQRLHSSAAREPILQQRESIITEIHATINHLSDTLVALQKLDVGASGRTELNRIRDELDRSLSVAKTVEARVESLVEDARIQAHEEPLET